MSKEGKLQQTPSPSSAYATAQVAGPLFILVFAFITLYTAQLLADMGTVNGKRQRTYRLAVEHVLGYRAGVAIAWIQYINLVLTGASWAPQGAMGLQLWGSNALLTHCPQQDSPHDDLLQCLRRGMLLSRRLLRNGTLPCDYPCQILHSTVTYKLHIHISCTISCTKARCGP